MFVYFIIEFIVNIKEKSLSFKTVHYRWETTFKLYSQELDTTSFLRASWARLKPDKLHSETARKLKHIVHKDIFIMAILITKCLLQNDIWKLAAESLNKL